MICLALYFVVEHDDVTKIVIKIWIYKHINIFSNISFSLLYAIYAKMWNDFSLIY